MADCLYCFGPSRYRGDLCNQVDEDFIPTVIPQKRHREVTRWKLTVSAPTNPLKHTLGHIDCAECERLRAQMLCSFSADLGFREAADKWLAARKIDSMPGAVTARYIRKTTEESYTHYLDTLELFFGGMRLKDIHLGHLAAYQRARIAGSEPFVRFRRPQDAKAKILPDGSIVPPKGKTPCPAKPKKVNQELCLLRHLMMRANCWLGEMEELYEPLLEEDEEIPRALTPQEQRHWLEVSRLAPKWLVVHWYSLLAFGTCMNTDEIRSLRIGDVNLFQRVLIVRKGKVKQRARTIELVGADVIWALEQLLVRAKEMGAGESHHFLFPWRVAPGIFDPTKPMTESGIKKCWEEVRATAKLTWFRQYDCRHTAITRLAEAGVPVDVIMSRAGHVSEKMRRHYTHISQAAQRGWVERASQFQEFAPPYRPQAVGDYHRWRQ